MKEFLVECWSAQLTILELRSKEVAEHRINLQQNISSDLSEYQAMTYEGDNCDCLEVVAFTMITLIETQFDASVSNSLAFVFAYPSLVSLQNVKAFYMTELPKLLTDEERASVWKDMLTILQNPAITDLKKYCVLTYSVIPLFAATFGLFPFLILSLHNPSVNRSVAIPSSFLDDYLGSYLSSIDTKQPTLSTELLVGLLRFNTLLIKHLTEYVSPRRNTLFAFAWDLYQSTDDTLLSWSLLFLCQFINSCQISSNFTIKIFFNILHLYKNSHSDIIYRAASLLTPCTSLFIYSSIALMAFDTKTKETIYTRVRQNMLMNEHILDQQIHIWRLFVLFPEFFYPSHERFSIHILTELRHIGTRSANAYANRELYLNLLYLLTAYAIRAKKDCRSNNSSSEMSTDLSSLRDSTDKQASQPSRSDTRSVAENTRLIINTHLTIQACRLLLIASMYPAEQSLTKRGFDLIQMILSLSPHIPLKLKEIDDSFPFFNKTLMAYKETDGTKLREDQLYQMIMPIVVSFRISAMSLVYFKNEFLEKNAENLQKKICRVLEYVDRSYVFGSMIELLPGMASSVTSFIELFACPLPYSTSIQQLLSAVRDALFDIFRRDIRLINPESFRHPTRAWRVLYLIRCIIQRTPTVMYQFARNLILACDPVYTLFQSISTDSRTQRYLFTPDNETILTYHSFLFFTHSSDETSRFGLPPIPKLADIEVIYSIQLLMEILTTNFSQLGEHHDTFITFSAHFMRAFFQISTRTDLLTFTLQLFTKLLESEEDLLTVREVVLLLSGSREVHMAQESVLYEGLVSAHWKFIFAVCKRFVGMD